MSNIVNPSWAMTHMFMHNERCRLLEAGFRAPSRVMLLLLFRSFVEINLGSHKATKSIFNPF